MWVTAPDPRYSWAQVRARPAHQPGRGEDLGCGGDGRTIRVVLDDSTVSGCVRELARAAEPGNSEGHVEREVLRRGRRRRDRRGRSRDAADPRAAEVSRCRSSSRSRASAAPGKKLPWNGRRGHDRGARTEVVRRRRHRALQRRRERRRASTVRSPRRPARSSSTTRARGAWTPRCPLVVPEVNMAAAKNRPKGIIANPNCSTIQMVVALKPLHDAARIKHIIVSTYQATSGKGHAAVEELLAADARRRSTASRSTPTVFPGQIAFNVLMRLEGRREATTPKRSGRWCTRRARSWATTTIGVSPTTVRVPVVNGHSEAVHVQFHRPMSADEAKHSSRTPRAWCSMDEPTRPASIRSPIARVRHRSRLRRSHPRRPRGAGRAEHVRRRRQPAQGRGAQRGADRRAPLRLSRSESSERATRASTVDWTHRVRPSKRVT